MTRKWTEAPVLELINHHGKTDPEQIIRDQVGGFLRDAEQTSLPIDVDMIASVLGIKSTVGSFDFAGRIYAEDDGQLVINLNADDRPPRQRFTAAHELIHTCFPGFKKTSYRLDLAVGSNPINREEEYLCDFGAAELLMPRHLVEGTFDIADGLDAVCALAEAAEVSLEAAANRLTRLAKRPTILMVLRMGHKPADGPALRRGESVPEKLRIRYCVAEQTSTYVPRFKGAEDGSALSAAWRDQRRHYARETLPGAPRQGLFDVEAEAFGSLDIRKVLAIATPATN